MANKSWCRHYRALADHDTCKIGITYESVKDTRLRPYRWPCIHPDVTDQCDHYEGYTDEEIAERDRQVQAVVEAFNALSRGESDICPHCGEQITWMRQVGRSTYASCGCRLWQGSVPVAWSE